MRKAILFAIAGVVGMVPIVVAMLAPATTAGAASCPPGQHPGYGNQCLAFTGGNTFTPAGIGVAAVLVGLIILALVARPAR